MGINDDFFIIFLYKFLFATYNITLVFLFDSVVLSTYKAIFSHCIYICFNLDQVLITESC